MVARSNKWYSTWPEGPTYRENLSWTDRFFKNNVSPELAEKVSEVYMTFPMASRGGPLFFAIMMETILSQTEEAVLSLQTRLKKMDLKSIPGENVDKAIGLARAAIVRLETFHKVPDDIIRTILRIFQTSSVPAFNDFFKYLEQQRKVEQALATTRVEEKLTPAGLFRAASAHYRSLWEEGLWTGIRAGGDSVFHNTVPRKCWNCGSPDHGEPQCPKPKDPSRIEANRKKMLQDIKRARKGDTKQDTAATSKSKSKSTTESSPAPGKGKWRKPEPSENNRRVINGRTYHWNPQAKRWVPERDTGSGSAAANTATLSPAPPSGSRTSNESSPSPSTSTGGNATQPVNVAQIRARLANVYAEALGHLQDL